MRRSPLEVSVLFSCDTRESRHRLGFVLKGERPPRVHDISCRCRRQRSSRTSIQHVRPNNPLERQFH